MRISLRWLSDYIDLNDLTPLQIGETLTQLGLELEGIETITALKGEVVIGKITEAVRHPNADKLQVCQVSIGQGEPLQIVCGAPNARTGLKVVVARIGATLPGDFKIKESKIRGENSFGMLCSEKELGLNETQDGIIEIPESAPLGTAISEYFALNDTIIEISVTPNRSDCLGILGLARDLAARLKRPLKKPEYDLKHTNEALDSAAHISVHIEDQDASQRFVALYVQNVSPLPSPRWLQQRLLYAGMRAVNLIVDATNYVMLEAGQPIHAYDERHVKGRQIKVRKAVEGESLLTLDGQSRSLTASDRVIADAEHAIGLAGVMGGANSEIQADTQNIIIEVAHFNPIAIRKTAKRFALHTEASHRFERGTDIENIPWVARRVADLIYKISEELRAEGQKIPLPEIAGRIVDVYPNARPQLSVALRLPRLRQITALSSISREEILSILGALGFPLLDKANERLLFGVPSWRHDIEREIDLIEEVTRVYGFDKIPRKMPMMQISALPEHPMIDFLDQFKTTLALASLSEVITFPFMHNGDFSKLGIKAEHPLAAAVKLANPLVEQHSHLRSTLIPGLIACVLENRRHGQVGVKLFEAARSFHEPQLLPKTRGQIWAHLSEQGEHIPLKARQDNRPIERSRIAGILDQPWSTKAWDKTEEKTSFFHGKQLVWQCLAAFGITELTCLAIDADDLPYLHPGAAATIWSSSGNYIGYVGELHPRSAKAYDLDFSATPVVFELNLEPILFESQSQRLYAKGSAKFPAIVRDFALMVDQTINYSDFMRSFANFSRRKYLREQRLFDVYQGPNMPSGKKSLAFSLIFQSDDKTLTDKDVEKEIEALLSQLKDDLSAELR